MDMFELASNVLLLRSTQYIMKDDTRLLFAAPVLWDDPRVTVDSPFVARPMMGSVTHSSPFVGTVAT